MRISVFLSALIVLSLVVLAACGTASKSDFPTGRFVSTSDSSLEYEFKEDNTWSYYMGGLMAGKGTFKVEDDLWIEQGTSECPGLGTYKWSFDGSTLGFTLQGEDQCLARKDATDGQTFQMKK